MDTQAQISNLSLRQKEILRLIAQHMQAKEVAIALKISEHTVRTHTVSARRKLGGPPAGMLRVSSSPSRMGAAHSAPSSMMNVTHHR